jgi:hypothetical protein
VPYFTVLFTSGGYTAGRVLLASTASNMPSGVSYQCQSPAQWFSDAGVLQGEVPITSLPTGITGSGAATYPGGVGAVVYWNTGAFNGGRKVRGRTYFVPLSSAAFANDGTLAAGLVTALQSAVNTFVGTTPPPAVNTRSLGKPGRGNSTYAVQSGSVKDRSAFLRTRRT